MHGRGVTGGACMAGGVRRCVGHSVHSGACIAGVWQGGMCGRGACMAGGVRGMCGRGHVWQGACVARGIHGWGHVRQGSMCGEEGM